MPELPEVETIRRSLIRGLIGASIEAVEVNETRLRKPVAANLAETLEKRRFVAIERHGKALLLVCDDRRVLLVHFGMSGTLELRPNSAPRRTHDHVSLVLDNGHLLIFNDPRRFGLLRCGQRDRLDELRHLGPDALDETWPAERLRVLARGRRTPIKSLLMDQRGIAGIGNIYTSEILYHAGIRPWRRASRLRLREFDTLATALPAVLNEAVRLGGSSISDFRDGRGRPGYFQQTLAVYGRTGLPCPACATTVRRRIITGRSSFYCPRCQR